jgi:hypothetical protein
LIVSIVSTDENPIGHAVVRVVGTKVRGVTGALGTASLSRLRPGAYRLIVSARGYYTAEQTVRLRARAPAVVTLSYRPPLGTLIWNIGPAGEYWDVGVVTRAAVTATEYDWTCSRDEKTGKEVGSWLKFAGALPYAVAPNTIAPEWVRGGFPASGPPKPRAGCGG